MKKLRAGLDWTVVIVVAVRWVTGYTPMPKTYYQKREKTLLQKGGEVILNGDWVFNF